MAATVAERARAAKKPDAPDYPGCAVYTLGDEKAGVLKERFVSAEDGIEYLHVKTGLLGLRSFLVPARAVAEEGERRVLVFRQELERACAYANPEPGEIGRRSHVTSSGHDGRGYTQGVPRCRPCAPSGRTRARVRGAGEAVPGQGKGR
jgi:hypothetical protein